jgi:Glycosyltransferase family 87
MRRRPCEGKGLTTSDARDLGRPGAGAGPNRWIVSPIRIRWPRLRLWAVALFAIGLVPIVAAPFNGYHDWPAFWSAGTVVGTADLVDGNRLLAWQGLHGLSLGVFPYLPASALFLWPFALLPLGVSFWLWMVAMLACALGAARIAARIYGLSVPVAVAATLAWAPVTGAIVIGQNTPLALLMISLAIAALVAEEAASTGFWSGLLLYKPTIGLPLIGLLVLRGRWRALAVSGLVVAAWYVGGIVASGGNVAWPSTWLNTILGYVGLDAAQNADKAVSLPGLLSRLPVPGVIVALASILLVAIAIPRLIRAPIREAAAGACLVGVAASPHAWGYDAVMVLPIIWWALAGGIVEPWRTRLIVLAYVLAPFWLVSRQTVLSALAVVVLGATAIWLSGRWRSVPAPQPGDVGRKAVGAVGREALGAVGREALGAVGRETLGEVGGGAAGDSGPEPA